MSTQGIFITSQDKNSPPPNTHQPRMDKYIVVYLHHGRLHHSYT